MEPVPLGRSYEPRRLYAVADTCGFRRYPLFMRVQKPILDLSCFALFVVTVLAAQEIATARISISVTDIAGAAIANAEIRLIPSPVGSTPKMATDEKGRLSLELKPGGYGLFVTEPGFSTLATHLEVRESKAVQTFPIVLQLAKTGSPTVYPPSFKDALVVEAFPYHEPVALQPGEFKALPHTKVTVHNSQTNSDDNYSGVLVADLLSRVGAPLGKEFYGVALTSYVVAAGADGYEALFTLAEVDPSVHSGAVLVADAMNGHLLEAKSGPFKLVVTEDKLPVRSVHKLQYIALKSLD